MLRDQTTRIHEQAASSTIEIDKLKASFQNIYQTMDAIATFKTKALGTMQQTVDTLSTEVAKAKTYVDRVRDQDAAAALSTRTDVHI